MKENLTCCFNSTYHRTPKKNSELDSRVMLQDRINILSLICEANLGKPIQIQSNISLVGVKGFTGGAATDGRTIYLPEAVCSFKLFKLMALHQSMLLDNKMWQEDSTQKIPNPVKIHRDADDRLLNRFPGLRDEMERQRAGRVNPQFRMPWWGDILPDLTTETNETIQQIKKKAAEHIDCPPDVVEALLACMIAKGQRNIESLWDMLRLMLNITEFGSPAPEDLSGDIEKYYYKEWDKDLSNYKKDWCLVRQHNTDNTPNPFVDDVRTRLNGLVASIRRQFLRFKPENFRKLRAQSTGDSLDIDALVQAIADRRAGSFLTENVYIRRDKTIRDVAVLFLLDISASTDAMVNGRRVIDIQKEAVVLMSEALNALEDRYALFGFYSDGRFRANMFTIKDFSEPTGEQVDYRIGNLEPYGLTRLGAAVRHATSKLEAVQARVKLMVILTDGRPYDLEYGDTAYAIADTKKAIQEAGKQKIHPFIITSDKEGAGYLKKISPSTQNIILPKVELLPGLLPAIYKRLTR